MSCGYKIILPDLAVFNRHTAHCYGVMNSAPQKANSVCLSTTFIESENLTQKKRALGDNETWCTEHETHLVVPLKTLMGLFSREWKNSLFACLFSYQFREFQTATVCLAIPVAKTNDLYPLPYCDPPSPPVRTHAHIHTCKHCFPACTDSSAHEGTHWNVHPEIFQGRAMN